MNEYYDEHEQGEAVKKWLADNAGAIIVGIVLGLGGLFGWQYWQGQQLVKQQEAAEALANLLEQDSAASASDLDKFLEDVDSRSFATMAALHLSGKAMAANEIEEASAILARVVKNGEPKVMRSVAAIRLARLQLEMGQLDDAEAQLTALEDTAFAGLAAEVHGDLLLARGDRTGARDAYQKAFDQQSVADRALLQMKLDDLAGIEAEGS